MYSSFCFFLFLSFPWTNCNDLSHAQKVKWTLFESCQDPSSTSLRLFLPASPSHFILMISGAARGFWGAAPPLWINCARLRTVSHKKFKKKIMLGFISPENGTYLRCCRFLPLCNKLLRSTSWAILWWRMSHEYYKMKKKDTQSITPLFLLLDSTDIKFLCQIATKVSRCLL
jgi:hypothetical protein